MHPGLAALVQHIPPDPDASSDTGQGDLATLQDVIDDFPKLLHALKNGDDVHDAVTALRLLTGIQKRLMGGAPGGPAQAQR